MLYFSVPLGKLVRRVSRLRGGGSALPGLVVEKIDPGFMQRTLSTPPARRRRGQRHQRQDHHHENGGGAAGKPGPEGLHQPHRKQLHPRRGGRTAGRRGLARPAGRGYRRAGTGRGPRRALRQPCPAALQPAAERAARPVGPLRGDRQDRPAPPAHRLQDNRDRGARTARTRGWPGSPVRCTAPRSSILAWTTRCCGTFPSDDELRAGPGSPVPAAYRKGRRPTSSSAASVPITPILSTTASRSPPG